MFTGWASAAKQWWGRLISPAPPDNLESSLGRRGEKAAARFLRSLGYKIVSHGDRRKLGEIDLVAIDGQAVVFVEVKTRKDDRGGEPAEAVGQEKQRRLTRLAIAYLKQHRLLETRARFDVVSIQWPPQEKKPVIRHYVNAFEPIGSGMFD